jgi:beta-lactamase regulating signal transducer with metallopeptidase domain
MLETLAGAALRTLLLAVVVGAGLRLRRTHNPHLSLAAWTLVLAASFVMPVATWLAGIALADGAISVAWSRFVAEQFAPEEAAAVIARSWSGVSAALADWPQWSAFASWLYFAVSGVLMLRLLAGFARSYRIARAATPIGEDRARGFDVRASSRVDTPATFGSIILVPTDHVAWPPEKRSAVLAHEGAHVARHDFAIQLAASVHRALFWFTPLSWWLRRHLCDLAEVASDDAAIAGLDDRIGYARILLEISGRVPRLSDVVAMARGTAIATRIERILADRPLEADIGRRERVLLVAGIVPIAVLLALAIVPPARTLAPAAMLGDAGPAANLADAGPADSAREPTSPDAPAIAMPTVERSPATEAAPAAPIPTPAPPARTEIARPAPPSSAAPPPRMTVTARDAPSHATGLVSKSALVVPSSSRAMRRERRIANVPPEFNPSPRPAVVTRVAGTARTSNGLDPRSGAASPDGQVPLSKRVADATCAGTYWDHGMTTGVHAHFFRGRGDVPLATFHFDDRTPATVPMIIKGSEIRVLGGFGTTYKLSPSGDDHLTGTAEYSVSRTIDFACGGSNARPS